MQTLTDITASSLVEWAATLPGVTSRQLERLKRLVPGLTTEELRSLKTTLEQNEKEREAARAVLDQVKAREKEFLNDQNRAARENKEAIEQLQDAQKADQYVTNI